MRQRGLQVAPEHLGALPLLEALDPLKWHTADAPLPMNQQARATNKSTLRVFRCSGCQLPACAAEQKGAAQCMRVCRTLDSHCTSVSSEDNRK